jgi:hypothetical protein
MMFDFAVHLFYFDQILFFFLFRDKFQNATRQIQSLNQNNFEIKKKVWSVDPNEHYNSSVSQPINEIDVSEKKNFFLFLFNQYFFLFSIIKNILNNKKKFNHYINNYY